ncbi:MAG: sulfotransferase domain-containing protein [Candidatus Sulfotelmatobacter sp.]
MNYIRRRIRGLATHIQRVTDVAFDKKSAGRDVEVLPGDVFIVSYPKSGNTWTRFLLGNLIYQDEPITFANVEDRLPSLYLYSNRKLRKLPRILKSHDCFDPRYKTVIYIVRDPRDVLVSAYHYAVKLRILPANQPIEDFIPGLLDGTFRSGFLVDPRWGSWHDNVASWLAMRHNRKFLLLRYEDMLENPERELAKVSEFLEIPATPARLGRAVQLSSAENMRKLEKAQSSQWTLTKNTRTDIAFVREARSGNWESELPVKVVQQIEAAWGPLMRTLGYALTTLDSEESGRASLGSSSEPTILAPG